MCERCEVQRCDFRAALNGLREELFCSSNGRLFQKVIERGRKLERNEDLLTRETGQYSFLNVCPKLCDSEGNSSVKSAGLDITGR